MTNNDIANGLCDIAAGIRWDGEALFCAEQHVAATFADRIIIRKYQHGIAKGIHHVALQDIANRIRASK